MEEQPRSSPDVRTEMGAGADFSRDHMCSFLLPRLWTVQRTVQCTRSVFSPTTGHMLSLCCIFLLVLGGILIPKVKQGLQ